MMALAADKERQRFRLAPVDKTGVFLGLSIIQLVVTGTGALIGPMVMVFISVPIGALIGVTGATAGLARVAGEPIISQVPNLIRHSRTGSRKRAWHAPLPILGPNSTIKKTPALLTQTILPTEPTAYGIDIPGVIAVVHDKTASIYSTTVRVAGRQFGLLEPHEQDYQLANWGTVLQGFVSERPAIANVRWCEWAAPSGIEEQRDWLDAHKANQPLPDALASYERLLAEAGPIATRHEVLLTISTHPSRIRIEKRHGHNRHQATIEGLLSETRMLVQRLQSAGLTAKIWTPPN